MNGTDASVLPLLAVGVPFVVAVLVVLARRAPDVRETITVVGATATFLVIAAMLPGVLDGRPHELTLLEFAPGVELGLRADGLGMVFALSAGFLWILASLYAIGYMRGAGEKKQTRFFASFALCLASTFGLAFSADLLTFFLFYELLTVATYPLVVHKETDQALAAGRRYLAYLLSGGVMLLLAVAIIYQAAGDLTFQAGGFAGDHLSDGALLAVFLLMVVGFGTKSGIMPLHAWLPSAMVAPTPVSALLHAVAVVKAGVFGFARAIGFVLGPGVLAGIGATRVLASLAAATIVIASIIALRQDNLKRRLAFSTIAHLSYIILGLSIFSEAAWDGALLHIVNHAALKITLFFCAGAIYVHAHLDRVSQLDGIGRGMPFTMGAFALASLGLAGLPPMGGFVSKTYLVLGAADAGDLVFAAVLLSSGLFTVAYLFPIVYRAFFVAPKGDTTQRDASAFMVVPLSVTAIVSLALGLGDVFGMYDISTTVAASVIGGAP
jgi:multicomponent Na+:H+ antiporter subunit D